MEKVPQEVAQGSTASKPVAVLRSRTSTSCDRTPGWVLIDAAWRRCSPIIGWRRSRFSAPGRGRQRLPLTHFHPDHSGSALELARRWRLPVEVHPDELPFAPGGYDPAYAHPLDRWVVAPLLRLIPRQKLRRCRPGTPWGVQRWRLTRPHRCAIFPNGSDPTPGHTPGHAAFFRRRDGLLITGDAVITVNVNSRDLVRKIFRPPWITTHQGMPGAPAQSGGYGTRATIEG